MKDTPNGFAVFAYKNIALEIVDAYAIPILGMSPVRMMRVLELRQKLINNTVYNYVSGCGIARQRSKEKLPEYFLSSSLLQRENIYSYCCEKNY